MPINKFPEFIFYEKESDDWVETIDVSTLVADLSGWAGFVCLGKPESALTSNVSAASFTAAVEMVSITGGELDIFVDDAETVNLVDDGYRETNYYADVEGIDPSGNQRTLANIVFRVQRKFSV